MIRTCTLLLFLLCCLASVVQAEELILGPRAEITHPGKVYEVEISGTAIAVTPTGDVVATWAARAGESNALFFARFGEKAVAPVRINPEGLTVDSLHQAPGIAVGPGEEIYISWSSAKPKPEGVFFASDLRLSRSLDGGKSFDSHIRVNEDRPISHSFEGMATIVDGTVLLSWIDSRDGWEKAGTYLARVGEHGTRVESITKLDGDTCVCCRVDMAASTDKQVAIAWRKVFPDDLRDMVLAFSDDSGHSFAPPLLVHKDQWQLNACPHRGGSVAVDRKGRVVLAWYTEGAQRQPQVLFAVSERGRDFSAPQRLDTSTASIPDHVRMAANSAGAVLVVWEDATAVRRQILGRFSTDGGQTFAPIQVLSRALQARAPDVAVSSSGAFVVAWQEEQFPLTKTVIQEFRREAFGAGLKPPATLKPSLYEGGRGRGAAR